MCSVSTPPKIVEWWKKKIIMRKSHSQLNSSPLSTLVHIDEWIIILIKLLLKKCILEKEPHEWNIQKQPVLKLIEKEKN